MSASWASASVGNKVTFQRSAPLALRSMKVCESERRAWACRACLAGSALASSRVLVSLLIAIRTSKVSITCFSTGGT